MLSMMPNVSPVYKAVMTFMLMYVNYVLSNPAQHKNRIPGVLLADVRATEAGNCLRIMNEHMKFQLNISLHLTVYILVSLSKG